jgi:hypothetical protein
MKMYTAKRLLGNIEEFKKDLKGIDIEKADKIRNGQYTIALNQLKDLEEGRMELEELSDPDNILRNIMMLSHLDKTDLKTRKLK